MADWAASVLLLRRAVMVNFARPAGERRPGKCAADAQAVTAEEESPIRAVRRGWVGPDIFVMRNGRELKICSSGVVEVYLYISTVDL